MRERTDEIDGIDAVIVILPWMKVCQWSLLVLDSAVAVDM